MATTTEPSVVVSLDGLGLDQGGHLLVNQALKAIPVGGALEIAGTDPHLRLHLQAWARQRGHQVNGLTIIKGAAGDARWRGAERAGETSTAAEHALATWGFAARGSLVELGGPALVGADLDVKSELWADLVPKLYAQAIASQWDPNAAIDWCEPNELPDDIERAVVQVMTFLIENEQAALVVPARFIGRVHPHFREVLQLLAVQLADEARHVEVFTRRASLRSPLLGTSGAGGRASLQTLLDESEFSVAMFLLSVLGEGTFLHLLSFIERNAPDRLTATIAHLVLQDEARHVAFGLGHLQEQLRVEPALRERLQASIVRRHDALAATAGLNEDVFDALVVLAAGSWTTKSIGEGYAKVQELEREMDEGRQRRLVRLGFSADVASELSALHTRNFM
ncbi:MAG: hypothetical protein WA860_09840 [Acidimicrobiales bacterium]|jgi:hypothetical protein